MTYFNPYSLNIKGNLLTVDSPLIMGILNVTPDSFYDHSRCNNEALIVDRIHEITEEGGDIIDIGGYSSRPMADDISASEEIDRLSLGLRLIKKEAPDAIVSIDTFRAEVAEYCVKEYGADIINDISAGELDCKMMPTVARLHVPYIMMHMRGNPHTMNSLTDYNNLTADILEYFSNKIKEAEIAGITDVIIDPGFGFSKTLEQNYELLNDLEIFKEFNLPLLVGISRKSIIYKLLNSTPAQSLNGTTVLNTITLLKGASILRVHDVKQAVETKKIVAKMASSKLNQQPL